MINNLDDLFLLDRVLMLFLIPFFVNIFDGEKRILQMIYLREMFSVFMVHK